jgi:hypothetical protein
MSPPYMPSTSLASSPLCLSRSVSSPPPMNCRMRTPLRESAVVFAALCSVSIYVTHAGG